MDKNENWLMVRMCLGWGNKILVSYLHILLKFLKNFFKFKKKTKNEEKNLKKEKSEKRIYC